LTHAQCYAFLANVAAFTVLMSRRVCHSMPSRYFPTVDRAGPEGLVHIGGALSTPRLLDAYRHGIFPWPSNEHEPILWWSPDPRAILPLDGMYVSRRLARNLRGDKFRITFDAAFDAVIEHCAEGPGRDNGTWITRAMREAYGRLHREGHAHSVEAWIDETLVGGVYGVTVGGLFAAESMFYRTRDGSKVALAKLVEHMNCRGFKLLDVQQWTPHTGSLGVIEISRRDYLRRLAAVVDLPVTF
jgi:leucyl/phenylalanyl-tRNA--protein transferase